MSFELHNMALKSINMAFAAILLALDVNLPVSIRFLSSAMMFQSESLRPFLSEKLYMSLNSYNMSIEMNITF